MKSETFWIMLTTKLSTQVSPPKMSIHYSFPWPEEKAFQSQKKRLDLKEEDEDDTFFFDDLWGKEPNWKKARAIFYKGEKIRVFPHEFSVLKSENMASYANGNALELVEDESITKVLGGRTLKTRSQHEVYDAALVDGCNHWEAMMVAFGEEPTGDFPPVGWWRLREDYASIFCRTWEMTE